MIPALITLAALLLLCIGCVVFVPFHLSLAGRYAGGFSGSLRVSWLWGALKIEQVFDERKTSVYFLGMRSTTSGGGGKAEKKRITHAKSRAKRRGVSGILPNIPEAVRLFRKVFRSLSPRGSVRTVFGFADPADTGRAFGLASAFRALVPLPVQFIPDFGNSGVTVSGMLAVRVFVAGLLAIGIGEFLTPQGRALMRALRQ